MQEYITAFKIWMCLAWHASPQRCHACRRPATQRCSSGMTRSGVSSCGQCPLGRSTRSASGYRAMMREALAGTHQGSCTRRGFEEGAVSRDLTGRSSWVAC